MNDQAKLPEFSFDQECTDFIVSVDNSVHQKSREEIFIFAIVGVCGKDTDGGDLLCILQGKIHTEFTSRDKSPFDAYCKELASRYDAKVLYEAELE